MLSTKWFVDVPYATQRVRRDPRRGPASRRLRQRERTHQKTREESPRHDCGRLRSRERDDGRWHGRSRRRKEPRRRQKPDRTLKKTLKKGPRHDCGAARETTGNGTGDRDAERGPVAPKPPPRYIESSSKHGESVGKAARQAASERIAKQMAAAMFCPRWRRAL